MVWDFNDRPELPTSMMDIYYFSSPHKQIFEDFDAEIVKVIDGDTVTLRTKFRDFDFPLRFHGTNAKELGEGGEAAADYLERILDGEQVRIGIDPTNRVGKWGRLLGIVFHRGINMNNVMIQQGKSTTFDNRNEGKIPDIAKELSLKKWF